MRQRHELVDVGAQATIRAKAHQVVLEPQHLTAGAGGTEHAPRRVQRLMQVVHGSVGRKVRPQRGEDDLAVQSMIRIQRQQLDE